MIKIVTTTILFFLCFTINAQIPNWLWAKKAGDMGNESGIDMAKDSNGNIIVVGEFTSSTIQFESITLTNLGASDNFIVKYSPNGDVIWAKSFGGAISDGVRSVALDQNNNIVIVGYFSSNSLTIGTITVNETPGNISSDMFIAKLDPSGNALWLKVSGGVWDDSFSDVAVDNMGNIFATGAFEGPNTSFGSINVAGAGPGHSKACIVKYDTNGNVVWAKTAGGSSSDGGESIAIDSNGDVYVCGNMASATIMFDAITLTNLGNSDSFIVKFNSNGTALWARIIGGASDDGSFDIQIDNNNNPYVLGYYYSPTINFGTTVITNAGDRDFYIAKYNSMGVPQFIKRGGGVNLDTLTSITIDGNDNLYACGWYFGATTTIEGNVLNNTGSNDIVILKYNSSGNLIWYKEVEGSTSNYLQPNCVYANQIGELFMTGYFSTSTINFDGILLNNVSTYTEEFYLSKLSHFGLGMEENIINEKIKISRNPFSDYTTLLFDKEYKNGIIDIYDSKGLIVKHLFVNGNQILINRDNLSSGLYLINFITDDNEIYSKKIIIN